MRVRHQHIERARLQQVRFGAALLAVAAASGTMTVAAAFRSSSPGDPVLFLEGVVRQIAANQYAQAWQTLDPAQQRLVREDEYVRCESASPIPGSLDWIRVVRVSDGHVRVAGVDPAPVASKAVTFRLRISESSLHASVVITHTAHAVVAGNRWAWILPPARLKLHRSGTCGSTKRTYR